MAETELMPKLVVGYAELGCSKLKKGKGFLKPNFELGPNSARLIALVIKKILDHWDAKSRALASAHQLPEPRALPQARLFD